MGGTSVICGVLTRLVHLEVFRCHHLNSYISLESRQPSCWISCKTLWDISQNTDSIELFRKSSCTIQFAEKSPTGDPSCTHISAGAWLLSVFPHREGGRHPDPLRLGPGRPDAGQAGRPEGLLPGQAEDQGEHGPGAPAEGLPERNGQVQGETVSQSSPVGSLKRVYPIGRVCVSATQCKLWHIFVAAAMVTGWNIRIYEPLSWGAVLYVCRVCCDASAVSALVRS